MPHTTRALSVRALTRVRTRSGHVQHPERKARLRLTTLEDRVTPVVVTIAPLADALEGGIAKLRVSRDDTKGDLKVNLDQTGTFDEIIGPLINTNVTIPDGQPFVDLNFATKTDTAFEGPETIVMTIMSGSYTIGTPAAAAVTVVDLNAPLDAPAKDCGCGGPANMAQADIGITGAASSGDGVRYADGSVSVSATDLYSGGFGQSTGVERAWTNAIGYDAAGFDGGGVISGQLPYLRTDGTDVLAATGGIASTYFDGSGGTYAPRHMLKDTLTQNAGAKEYTLVTSAGAKLVFNNFDASLATYEKGQIKSITDPDGNVTTVTSRTADGKPLEVRRTAGSVIESYLYAYVASGTNAGKVASVTLRRSGDNGANWTTVRTVENEYYDTGSSNGPAGTLKLAVVKDGGGLTIDTKYYRYYTSSSSTGYTGALKYSFSADSYERLKQAYPTPDTATDTQVAVFATDYFEYDSVQRVTKHTQQGTGCSSCAGGLGTSTFTYTTSVHPDGYNSYRMKTVETRADGNTMTVYTNFAGQPVLEVYKNVTTGQQWITYHRYDSGGREVMVAHPTAVSGYSEAYGDLVHFVSGHDYQYLNDSAGLIETTSYGASTTATPTTPGDVAGYVYQTAVQRGDGGAGAPQTALQSTTQYFSCSDNPVTVTVYPVATQTQYRNTNGTGDQKTSYAYTFFTDSIQPQQVTTTRPTVTTGQNGPGTATSTVSVFDDRGRVIWSKDEEGFISHTVYDDVTGGITQTIADVNTALTADEPAGWTTPAGGGLHLTTTYELDDQGRATKITAPNTNVTYVVYKDASHETRTYVWNTAAGTSIGPTMVSREDRDLSYTETLTMSATPNQTGGRPDGTEAISGVQTLSREVLNEAGQVVFRDEYFNLTGITYSDSSVTLGTSGTNYNRTQLSYGKLGDLERTQTPSGAIYRTVFDGQHRAVSSWVGTDDTPTSGFWSPTNRAGTNLEQVSATVYDDMNGDGDGIDLADVGDGNLSHSFSYPSTADAPADARRTDSFYDWRDRQVAVKEGVQATEGTAVNRPLVYTDLDNLGQAWQTRQYDGDAVTLTDGNNDGVPDAPAGGNLRAQTKTYFDELGRVYLTEVNHVDPGNGAVANNSLKTNTWYNLRGMVVKVSQPGGLVQKAAYDGAGRVVKSFVTDGGSDTGWADADDVLGDIVLEQVETGLDASGNVLSTTARQRFHNAAAPAPGQDGSLGTPTSGFLARVSYAGYYYDKGDRLTDSVDVGTNGGTAWMRPGTVPARSDSVLVTSQAYDSAGRAFETTDPRGLKTRLTFDNLGRVTQSVENYVDGPMTDTDNKTVQFVYGPAGRTKVRVVLPLGGEQTTESVYGVSQAAGDKIDSLDIVKQTKHPGAGDGLPSGAVGDVETVTVNALGERLTFTDRNQSVHTYAYDAVGRPTSDAATTLGAGVATYIRRLETAYDGQGNAYLFTSYSAASGGTVVNQVKREFDGLGQMTKEWQSYVGVVGASSPKVQYTYTFDPAGTANESRLDQVTYPSGKDVGYTYDTAPDVGQVAAIDVNGTTVEEYTYLGLGTVVERAHPQPGVNLTYISQGEPNGDAGDQYTGLDRFGRVVDQRWYQPGTPPTDVDRYQYTYDRDSNRLTRTNGTNAPFNETYGYDGLNQLTSFSKTGTAKSWDYDAVGNWDKVTTNGIDQLRTHNRQNELLTATGQTSPTYDANGNQTKDFGNRSYTYDAWNRPRVAGSRTYEYDALGRRARRMVTTTTTAYFYDDQWRAVEDRVDGSTAAHYVWAAAGYVDELVLRDRGAERFYVAQDANYNVTAVFDDAGAVQERYAYDPYGTPSVYGPAWGSRSGTNYAWVYNHQGLRYDSGPEKYHARHRDYDPVQGRWMSLDPLSFDAGDENLYRYVHNSPGNHKDPFGLSDIDYVEIVKPKPGYYGLAEWWVQWRALDKEGKNTVDWQGTREGAIIQKVSIDVNVTFKYPFFFGGAEISKHFMVQYWEAWPHPPLKAGTKIINRAADGKVIFEEDHFTTPSWGVCTKGNMTITARAVFIDGFDMAKEGFKPGQGPETVHEKFRGASASLDARWEDPLGKKFYYPKGWDEKEKLLRVFSVKWDAINGDGKTQIDDARTSREAGKKK